MRWLVIGTIVRDRIHLPDGTYKESWGGLIYTINALLALMDENDTLTPVLNIGADIYESISTELLSDTRIDKKGLTVCQQKNNRVRLTYDSYEKRSEQSLHPLPPLKYENVQPFLSAVDAVLINMISGWDIALQDVLKVRAAFNGPIMMDMHSLALGRKPDGTRFYRPVTDGDRWIKAADVIQMNENEYEMFNPEKSAAPEYLATIGGRRPQIFNLMRGAAGSNLIIRRDQGIDQIHVEPPKHLRVVDPTGCGDTFLPGFAVSYLKNHNAGEAAKHANLAAALNGTFKGAPDIDSFREAYNRHSMR